LLLSCSGALFLASFARKEPPVVLLFGLTASPTALLLLVEGFFLAASACFAVSCSAFE